MFKPKMSSRPSACLLEAINPTIKESWLEPSGHVLPAFAQLAKVKSTPSTDEFLETIAASPEANDMLKSYLDKFPIPFDPDLYVLERNNDYNLEMPSLFLKNDDTSLSSP